MFKLRRFKNYLPRNLFARTFLIIVIPLMLAQLLATWVFYDRHYQAISARLATAVAAELDLVLSELDILPPDQHAAYLTRAGAVLDLSFSQQQGTPPASVSASDFLRETLTNELTERGIGRFSYGAWEDDVLVLHFAAGAESYITARVPLRRLYTPTTLIYIAWLLGATLVLISVSLVFMKNQIRPIRRLALAAEQFGKGIEVPTFKLEGAREVRQAAAAFLTMRNRLKRMIEQRTAMLAAISHDLRTPLTRMRLQLALLPESAELNALGQDIVEMEKMIEAYLAFARGDEAEKPAALDLTQLVTEITNAALPLAKEQQKNLRLKLADDEQTISITARPLALRRAITNLVNNALKFGSAVQITLAPSDYLVEVRVEDNGPGIAPDVREQVFKPFFQLDDSKAGMGLGLTIARDIARQHGGDIVLTSSNKLGGLAAILRLPV